MTQKDIAVRKTKAPANCPQCGIPFAENGFIATRVRLIFDENGVSHSTPYRHCYKCDTDTNVEE